MCLPFVIIFPIYMEIQFSNLNRQNTKLNCSCADLATLCLLTLQYILNTKFPVNLNYLFFELSTDMLQKMR